jgi:hypothetical protein
MARLLKLNIKCTSDSEFIDLQERPRWRLMQYGAGRASCPERRGNDSGLAVELQRAGMCPVHYYREYWYVCLVQSLQACHRAELATSRPQEDWLVLIICLKKTGLERITT